MILESDWTDDDTEDDCDWDDEAYCTLCNEEWFGGDICPCCSDEPTKETRNGKVYEVCLNCKQEQEL